MKKQHIVVAIVAAVVTCLGTSASADMYNYNGGTWHFVDVIDTTSEWLDALGVGIELPQDVEGALPVVEGVPMTYTHTIDDFAIPEEYRVTEASLELDFTNDLTDEPEPFFFTYLDTEEYVQYAYDGTQWLNLQEVDNEQVVLAVAIDWLNDDGELDVTIDVTNPGWNPASVYVDHSVLYGNVQAVPVPGAVLLGILGFGAAGLKLRKTV